MEGWRRISGSHVDLNHPGSPAKPSGLACDDQGHVYVGDTNNSRVQLFSGSGTFLTMWGSFGTSDGEFDHVMGVTIDFRNDVYVCDYQGCRIQKFAYGPTNVEPSSWARIKAGYR
jgi:hypothetical protein